jgi:hypothetical protein
MQPDHEQLGPTARWTVGCLVGAAAVLGTLMLVLLVALALQPPEWVQVVAGVLLAAGGALLAWMVATALGRTRGRRSGR